MPRKIFLSHAAADKPLAVCLASEIQQRDSTVSVFVASRPGDIRADQEWPSAIQAELRHADAYLVLLTPNSTDRPWVWFEAGAAWMSEKQLLLVLACGMQREQVPTPLSLWQLLDLEVATEAAAVFSALGISNSPTEPFSEEMRRLGATSSEAALLQQGWRGVMVGGAFYAWDGPLLLQLEDRNPIPEPPGLISALQSQGMKPGWTRPDSLARIQREGAFQVFQTDRRTYRRAIEWGDVVLTVRPV
jgi:TIR domain